VSPVPGGHCGLDFGPQLDRQLAAPLIARRAPPGAHRKNLENLWVHDCPRVRSPAAVTEAARAALAGHQVSFGGLHELGHLHLLEDQLGDPVATVHPV